jgi:hypothetical protein
MVNKTLFSFIISAKTRVLCAQFRAPYSPCGCVFLRSRVVKVGCPFRVWYRIVQFSSLMEREFKSSFTRPLFSARDLKITPFAASAFTESSASPSLYSNATVAFQCGTKNLAVDVARNQLGRASVALEAFYKGIPRQPLPFDRLQ